MEHRLALFEEGVEVIRQCWTGEPFSFKGTHYALEDVQIRPRPYQQPSPPLWIGGSVPAAARRAGRIADAFVGRSTSWCVRTAGAVPASSTGTPEGRGYAVSMTVSSSANPRQPGRRLGGRRVSGSIRSDKVLDTAESRGQDSDSTRVGG